MQLINNHTNSYQEFYTQKHNMDKAFNVKEPLCFSKRKSHQQLPSLTITNKLERITRSLTLSTNSNTPACQYKYFE